MIDGLVLAAGQGRRFGGGKLQALYRGRPLLAHVLDVVADAGQRRLLKGGHVVIATSDDRALKLVHAAGLEPILNDSPELGLSHSLRLGLTALEYRTAAEPSAALVFLGDQPLVRVEVIERLIEVWRQRKAPIIRPRYSGNPNAPGHPVLLSRSVWRHSDQLKGDNGFGALAGSGLAETVTVDVAGDNPDVDTRDDLQALDESL